MTVILLSAAEPSGDALGASLMRTLRAKRPGVRFVGGGGEAMIAEGLEDPLRTDALAVMGPLDALAALPKANGLAKGLAERAARSGAEAAVLIDSWAFSKIVADRIAKASPSTRLVKLAAPQVWASRPQRAKVAASLFDLLLCLLPFEPPYFEAEGGRALFVGNPNFQTAARQPRSGPAFRARHGLGEAPLLLMLPGSRNGEIKHLLPVFEETLGELMNRVKGLKVAMITAPAVEEKVREAVAGWDQEVIVVPPSERFDAFDAGDGALAASGTVTTELALTGTPMVVAYKVDRLTAYWARKVITTPYVSVLNVLAGEEVIPERIQEDCTPVQLSADVARLFMNEETRRKQISAFRRLLPRLIGAEDAAEVAAAAILDLVDGENGSDLHRRTPG